MTERWLPVVGYEGLYEVSDLGRVRSLGRDAIGRRRQTRILSPAICDRYPTVLLSNIVAKSIRVHRLVLEAFVGPCPIGMEARHFPDRDTTNYRLDNLRWDTRKNNHADKIAHGTDNRGERHNMAKLNAADVECIFNLRAKGWLLQEIADQIGVSAPHVSRILHGKKWAHMQQQDKTDD